MRSACHRTFHVAIRLLLNCRGYYTLALQDITGLNTSLSNSRTFRFLFVYQHEVSFYFVFLLSRYSVNTLITNLDSVSPSCLARCCILLTIPLGIL